MRFSILSLMAVVLIAALVVNWLRPVTQTEAEKIAEVRFLKVPGATRWIGRYKVHAWSAGSNEGDFWFVDFKESEDGTHLAQLAVMGSGKVKAVGLAPGKFK